MVFPLEHNRVIISTFRFETLVAMAVAPMHGADARAYCCRWHQLLGVMKGGRGGVWH
ncbi:MAG: hypothetical protein JRJ12_02070 [Deltaproteobacteria bacterium]|nr:hypothetical protein [Deltaproteobacteria bacterium]MBW2070817.1 hypothetical protein [Deltaproteobacteria bacterium]